MIAMNLNNTIAVQGSQITLREFLLKALENYAPVTGRAKFNLHRIMAAADRAELHGGSLEIDNDLFQAMTEVLGINLLAL